MLEIIERRRLRKIPFWTWITSKFMCGKQEPPIKACYIATIGVIDECRKLGIGTMLLNQTE